MRPETGDEPSAPHLPDDTPTEVREFVSCRSHSLELRAGRHSWLPKPSALPDPHVGVAPGPGPHTAIVTLEWFGGVAKLRLTASIVEGQLRLDAPRVPAILGGNIIRTEIENWVESFNAVLHQNGKQLSEAEVGPGILRLTKTDVVPAED